MNPPVSSSSPSVAAVVVGLLAGRPSGAFPRLFDDDEQTRRFVAVSRAHAVHLLVADRLRQEGLAESESARRAVAALEQDKPLRGACLLAAEARLGVIRRALAEADIPFCLLKGLALIHTLYRDHPLWRCLGDIDILVPENRMDATITAFRAAGYRIAEHKRDIEAIRRYGHKICFSADGPAPDTFDVHFRPLGKKLFAPTARLSTDVFFRDPAACPIGGAMVLIPNPELHFLYLCLHLALQHHLASLNWLYDLRMFTQNAPALDWDDFVARARAYRVGRAAATSLQAARDILDAAVPPDAMAGLLPRPPGLVAGLWIGSRLDAANVVNRRHEYRQRTVLGKFARMFSEVLLIDGDADRRRSVLRWVFPDPLFFRAAYRVQGRVRILLCYLVHPLVLLAMGVSIVLLTIGYAVEAASRRRGTDFRWKRLLP